MYEKRRQVKKTDERFGARYYISRVFGGKIKELVFLASVPYNKLKSKKGKDNEMSSLWLLL